MTPVEIVTVLICDDVRKEVTNKDILIGVYTADIVIPVFPAWINLAVWMEAIPKQTGDHKMVFRLGTSNRPRAELHMLLRVNDLKGPMGMALPGMQHLIEEETEFVLELQEGTEWRVLKRKKIIKGEVRLPVLHPTPASLPSNS